MESTRNGVIGYVVSNYAGDPDKGSLTEYIFTIRGWVIS